MKVPVLAVAFTAALCPMAMASEGGADCDVDDVRRATQQSLETPAPAPTVARPTVAQRDAPPARPAPDRRRNGKRIPDAELIGPRGAL